MSNFAKLFQVTPAHQVLLTIRYHPDIKKDVVTQFTVIGGIDIGLDVEFKVEDDANVAFDKYNHEKAATFYLEMVKILEDNQKNPPDDMVAA